MRSADGLRAFVLLYIALYGAFGVASPFWPKVFETQGLTPQQIGLLLAAGTIVRLAAGPVVGRLADILGAWRAALALCIVLSAAAASALLTTRAFGLLLVIALCQAAVLTPTTSLADSLSVNATKPQRPDARFEYGWIRGAASAAFVVGTLVVGQVITHSNIAAIIWLNVGLLLAAAAVTAFVPRPAPMSEAHTSDIASFVGGVRELLKLPTLRSVILVSALVYGSHATHDAFAVIRWSDAGVSPAVISVLWSEAVVAEVVVFLLIGPALLRRIGAHGAAVLAATAGIVRWVVAASTTSVPAIALIQPLHGLTFALLHLACMRLIGAVVPTGLSATAQALYAFGAALMSAALTFLSGRLYANSAGEAFLLMALLCALALPIAWFGFREPARAADAKSLNG